MPAPDGPTSATSWPGSMTSETSCSTSTCSAEESSASLRGVSSEAIDTAEAGRVAEPHVVELDAAGRRDQVDGAGPVLDGDGRVEHLEHPLEADQGRHEVDPGVGEAGERPVDPRDVGGHGHRACRW